MRPPFVSRCPLRLALALGVLALPASAQPRLSTASAPCAALQALVARQGAVVLGTGPHLYERFVSGGNACDRSETTEPAYAPAADNPQCFVGYRCKDRMRDPIGNID